MHDALFGILVMLGEGPAAAARLRERLRERGAGRAVPSIPAFYRHLKTGVDAGWIEIRGAGRAGGGRGRPRQVYALTRAGQRAVRQRATQLHALARLALGEPGR